MVATCVWRQAVIRVGYVLALLGAAIFWISGIAGLGTNSRLDSTARLVAGGVALWLAYLLRPSKGGRR